MPAQWWTPSKPISVDGGWVRFKKSSEAIPEVSGSLKASEDQLFPEVFKLNVLPWPVLIFILTLLIPTSISFYIDSLRITPYRVILIIFTVPSLVTLLSSPKYKLLVSDYLIMLYAFWAPIALLVNHDSSVAIESGGIHVLESIGAYLIGRIFITDIKKFWTLIYFISLIICLLFFVTLPEALTGKYIIRTLAGSETPFIGKRLGFHRAFGPFDHPIHYGVFCAGMIALSWTMLHSSSPVKKWLKTIWISICTLLSFSSGPLSAVTAQFILIFWHSFVKIKHRWKTFFAGLFFLYISISILSNRTPIKVALHYLTLSAKTAYNRLIIYEYGSQDVVDHPIFGIGHNIWSKPVWMHSNSMDTFWLYTAVTFGLPAALGIAGALLYMIIHLTQKKLDHDLALCRNGWVISIIGLCMSAATVHFWNILHIYFLFLIGIAAWLVQHPGQSSTEKR